MFFGKIREYRNQLVQSILSSEERITSKIKDTTNENFCNVEKKMRVDTSEILDCLAQIYKMQKELKKEIEEMKKVKSERKNNYKTKQLQAKTDKQA